MRAPFMVVALGSAFWALYAAFASAPAYDGNWWATQSMQDREGFVSGYLDCYIWAFHGRDYSDSSIRQQAAEVERFYKMDPSRSNVPIADALRKLGRHHTARAPGEPHGAYDGDYWRQSLARVAFIRGYLECERLHRAYQFPKSAEEYVSAISRWYGISATDESALNDKRAEDKIGNVLWSLRGRTP